GIKQSELRQVLLSFPPIPAQKAIAHILGSLDDKIELNRRMNATLEGMAQVLFKSWFVDFDPVIDNVIKAGNPIPDEFAARAEVRRQALADGTANREAAKPFPAAFQETKAMGWIPDRWKIGSFLDEAQLLSGGTPKTSKPEYWNGGVRWASAKDVSQCGKAFLIETEKTITNLGLNKSATKVIPKFSTVVVARGATTGRMTMFGEDIAMNQTCYGMRLKSGNHFYGYCHSKNLITNLVSAAHGSVFDTITTTTFESSKVLKAPENLTDLFEEETAPSFQKILSNQGQTSTLTKLRDTLLPKLISGELRIPDAEKMADQATKDVL
ncbi:MAG: restriction endonuclease subunit S, partial [Gammaproteobacteria bacterium]